MYTMDCTMAYMMGYFMDFNIGCTGNGREENSLKKQAENRRWVRVGALGKDPSLYGLFFDKVGEYGCPRYED